MRSNKHGYKKNGNTLLQSVSQLLNMAIFIVDLAMRNGDFPVLKVLTLNGL